MTAPSYTLRLPAELRERLELAAREDGLELAEWIRVALREALGRTAAARDNDQSRSPRVNDQPRGGTLYRQRLGAELIEALAELGWKAPA